MSIYSNIKKTFSFIFIILWFLCNVAQSQITGGSGIFSFNTQFPQLTPISATSLLFQYNNQTGQISPISGTSGLFSFSSQTITFTPLTGTSELFLFASLPGTSFANISPLFLFNLKYRINGIISDATTGLPVIGAMANTLGGHSLPTGEDGYYNLFVKKGLGHQVSAFSPMHESSSASDINVTDEVPIAEVDFELNPVPVIPVLQTINPDPNPEISIVQEGGILSRFYRVKNNFGGTPVFNIPVTVTSKNDFEIHYLTNEEGLVHIVIPSSEIGSGKPGSEQLFSITAINFETLDQPLEFLCQVNERKFDKFWDNYSLSKLGASYFAREESTGANMHLQVNDGYSPGSVNIGRQLRSGRGVSPSIGAALLIQMEDIIYEGAHIGVGADLLVSGITEDRYKFSKDDNDPLKALAKYIIFTSGSLKEIDITLGQLLNVSVNNFFHQTILEESIISESKGIDADRSVNAGAEIGLNVLGMVSIEAHANIEKSGRTYTYYYLDKENNHLNFGIELTGSKESSTGSGIMFKWPIDKPWGENMPKLNEKAETLGFRLETMRDLSTNEFVGFRFCLLERDIKNNIGSELVYCYEISGEDIVKDFSYTHELLTNLLTTWITPKTFIMYNSVFQSWAELVFDQIYEIQTDPNSSIDVSYNVIKKDIQDKIVNVPLRIELALKKINASYGREEGTEEGHQRIVEKGKYFKGHHYPSESYPEPIPTITNTFQQEIQAIIDNIPESIRLLFGSYYYITHNNNHSIFEISDTGTNIYFSAESFPDNIDSIFVASWGWYGNSPKKKITDVDPVKKGWIKQFREYTEDKYGMVFGIGGFYQFQPYFAELNSPALLTIKYENEEVIGIDESSLSVYLEDKENKEWIYIGGEVDIENKSVTVPINKLGVFTLAPEMPYKDFFLKATPDSVLADGFSTALFISDTIYYNNLTPVRDGELFTVFLSHGDIINADTNPDMVGTQVKAQDHKIQIEIRSPIAAGSATVKAESVNGSATGTGEIVYFKNTLPNTPTIIEALPGNNSVRLNWDRNLEQDLIGYKIYYDTDTISPFEGIHNVYGESSPIILGTDTTWRIGGLINDSTYYFFLSAYDISGNESPLSNFVSATPVSHFLVDLMVFPEGAGSVEGSGEYLPWHIVDIAATPYDGWQFDHWAENELPVSVDTNYQFNIFANREITAYFSPATFVQGSLDKNLKIYPNPAHTELWVEITNTESKKLKIELTNLQGQIVDQKTIDDQYNVRVNFNVSYLQPGVYLIILRGERLNEAMKVLIRP